MEPISLITITIAAALFIGSLELDRRLRKEVRDLVAKQNKALELLERRNKMHSDDMDALKRALFDSDLIRPTLSISARDAYTTAYPIVQRFIQVLDKLGYHFAEYESDIHMHNSIKVKP